jgi:hypothetical protein
LIRPELRKLVQENLLQLAAIVMHESLSQAQGIPREAVQIVPWIDHDVIQLTAFFPMRNSLSIALQHFLHQFHPRA